MEATELPITVFYTPAASGGETVADFSGFVVEQGDGVIYPETSVVADLVLSGKAATPGNLAASLAAVAEELQK